MITSEPDVSTEGTTEPPWAGGIGWDDATFVLITTFIVLSMQSGFGLLESGCVNSKNEVNIMYKNAADVIFGGTLYWLFGYGLSFGNDPGANAFCGVGYWAVNVSDPAIMGDVFVSFVFQLSFASTAATIVSGAMAERVKLHSYIIYASLNVFAYAIPAHWVWDSRGFLHKLGVVDIAGSGVVHMCGGTAALVASLMLGPRAGRYAMKGCAPQAGNATNVILGTFFLWWGWFGYNAGSCFGVQHGLWVSASRAAATTLIASMGGGVVGLFFSLVTKHVQYNVSDLCNGVLGALVSVSASCAVIMPWESFIIGFIGALICCSGVVLFDYYEIDDPVGAISVHGLCGIWGLLSVGLFMNKDEISGLNRNHIGLFHGGGIYPLGVQALSALCIITWSATMAFIILGLLHLSPLGLRMSEIEEEIGADKYEHGLVKGYIEADRTRSLFGGYFTKDTASCEEDTEGPTLQLKGKNHEHHTQKEDELLAG